MKCLPPQNKPRPDEIRQCNRYLRNELERLPDGPVIIGLGKIAHDAVLRALGLPLSSCPFGHGNRHRLADGKRLIDSYHCSRYNTQTRRLTGEMFTDIFRFVRELVEPRPTRPSRKIRQSPPCSTPRTT